MARTSPYFEAFNKYRQKKKKGWRGTVVRSLVTKGGGKGKKNITKPSDLGASRKLHILGDLETQTIH